MKTKLIFICLLGLSLRSFAEDAPGTAYRFNSQGSMPAEFDSQYQFANPGPGPDAVEKAIQDSPGLYNVPLGYPRKDLLVVWAPTFNSFSNRLSAGRAYNYGGLTSMNLDLNFRVNTSLEQYYSFDVSTTNVGVRDSVDTAAGLTVQSSTANLLAAKFASSLTCWTGETALSRNCVGYQVAMDSFPTLQFPTDSNTLLQLSTVRDMTAGLHLLWNRPAFSNASLESLLSADFGFGVGQSGSLTTTSNQKYTGQVALEKLIRGYHASLGAGLEYRQAEMESAEDHWSIRNLSYSVRLGLRWEWGTK